MRLKNTTDIPNDVVRQIIDFVKPPGISGFDVMLRNSTTKHLAGRAYSSGSGYHDRAVPFVVLRVPQDTHPRWTVERGGKHFTCGERPFSFKGEKITRQNLPTFPQVLSPYQRGQLRGKRYFLANRLECLVYVMAHELRHLWQAKAKGRKARGMAHGARGRFSEIDTGSYAIRMLRAWRKHYRDLGASVVDCPNVTPRLPASKADIAAKRSAAAHARLVKSFERNTAALKRWQTKEKRAVTAIKKLTRAIKRQQKTLAQKGAQ